MGAKSGQYRQSPHSEISGSFIHVDTHTYSQESYNPVLCLSNGAQPPGERVARSLYTHILGALAHASVVCR